MISSISERRRFESIRFSHKLTVKRAEKFRKDTENEKIIEELKTDKLTGLPSFLVLKYLIKNFNPQDFPTNTQIFCVYIDLKNVKMINDTQGHNSGDEYIKECAQKLSHCFRLENNQDFFLRVDKEKPGDIHRKHSNGDEFIALLTCPPEYTDQLSKIIEERLSNINNTDPKIAFRFGISSSALPLSKEENESYFQNLIHQADQDLNQKRLLETNPNSR